MTQDDRELIDHHGGRSLDASRDVALRDAALELLAEIGYDRLTIDSVAARARAGKATIYRRWSGKAELVVDALNCRKGVPADIDTGSLRGDLAVFAEGAASSDNQFDAQLMMGLVTALTHDSELREVFRERLIEPHIARLKQVFRRAIDRGEVPEDRNLDLLVSLFPALAIHNLLLFGTVPDAHFARQVMDEIIVPLATAPASTGNGLLPPPDPQKDGHVDHDA